ncbi:hypothetical protein ES708_14928 [subsurface metagenome]
MCIVIVTKYAELFPDTNGCLGKVGHQVGGNAKRKFPDICRWMGPDGIKIPKGNCFNRIACSNNIRNDLFRDLLCISVRGGGFFDGGFFRYRELVWLSVNGAGRGKNEISDTMVFHGIQQVDQGKQVVLIVIERFFDRFGHCFVCRKMYYCPGGRIPGKTIHEPLPVTEVQFLKEGFPAGDLFNPIQNLDPRIGQVVNNEHIVPRFHQFDSGV